MSITSSQADSRGMVETQKIVHYLTLGAVIGPLLFTLAWLILGFVSPGYTLFDTEIAPYSSISQPISGLGLGLTAPYMNTAFVLCGILIMVGVVAVFQTIRELTTSARWLCTGLLGTTGLGMIIVGFFDLEAVMMHLVGFMLGVGLPVISFFVTGRVLRRLPQWHNLGNWLLRASPLTLVLVVLFFATFSPELAGENAGVAGLTQRILVLEVQFWFIALGWLAFRRS